MRTLVEAGTTVLLTTHYLEEAEQLADRVAIMNGGRIAATGTVAELHALADTSTITFDIPADRVGTLPLTGDVQVDHHPDVASVTVRTTQPQDDVHTLTSWAARNALALRDLSVRPGGLAQLFDDIAGDDTPTITTASARRAS